MSDSPGPAPERVRDGAELARQARGGLSTTLPALLDGDSDQRFRAFAHDLFALSARVDEILRRHANFVKEKYEISLSAPAITVLTAASRMDPSRPILTKDLAKYLRVTRSAASMAMNELVRAKMVRKRVSEHDQRVKFFELTDLGWETLEKTNTEKRVVNDVWFRGLEREDFDNLARIVRLLVDNAEGALGAYAQMELSFSQEKLRRSSASDRSVS